MCVSFSFLPASPKLLSASPCFLMTMPMSMPISLRPLLLCLWELNTHIVWWVSAKAQMSPWLLPAMGEECFSLCKAAQGPWIEGIHWCRLWVVGSPWLGVWGSQVNSQGLLVWRKRLIMQGVQDCRVRVPLILSWLWVWEQRSWGAGMPAASLGTVVGGGREGGRVAHLCFWRHSSFWFLTPGYREDFILFFPNCFRYSNSFAFPYKWF